jgi:hypothetical protein
VAVACDLRMVAMAAVTCSRMETIGSWMLGSSGPRAGKVAQRRSKPNRVIWAEKRKRKSLGRLSGGGGDFIVLRFLVWRA